MWREATMVEALDFAHGRKLRPNLLLTETERSGLLDLTSRAFDVDACRSTDGSCIACLSQWCGPYSEVTPDVDAEPPAWFIYDPAAVPKKLKPKGKGGKR